MIQYNNWMLDRPAGMMDVSERKRWRGMKKLWGVLVVHGEVWGSVVVLKHGLIERAGKKKVGRV